MSAKIDFYFTVISPWAYLGLDPFLDVAAKHGADVTYRPVNLGPVFESSGGLPLGKRHPARQNYRLIEMQRWREKRGRTLNLAPKHFPTNPGLADSMIIALADTGADPADLVRKCFESVWANDLDVADETTMKGIADGLGLDGAALIEAARSQSVQKQYDANRDLAIETEIIGSPCYVLNGEPFWGQDRIGLLDDALASERAPFKP